MLFIQNEFHCEFFVFLRLATVQKKRKQTQKKDLIPDQLYEKNNFLTSKPEPPHALVLFIFCALTQRTNHLDIQTHILLY